MSRGYNIGIRLIEDLLARTGLGRCKDFAEVGEVMSKVRCTSALAARPPSLFANASFIYYHHIIPLHRASPPYHQIAFRSLLSIVPTVIQHPVSPTQPQPAFSLIFEENPLTDFVELPEEAVEGGLCYAKILEGVIRGSLEMVSCALRWFWLCTSEETKLTTIISHHRSKPR